jgi:hypothetical protein
MLRRAEGRLVARFLSTHSGGMPEIEESALAEPATA